MIWWHVAAFLALVITGIVILVVIQPPTNEKTLSGVTFRISGIDPDDLHGALGFVETYFDESTFSIFRESSGSLISDSDIVTLLGILDKRQCESVQGATCTSTASSITELTSRGFSSLFSNVVEFSDPSLVQRVPMIMWVTSGLDATFLEVVTDFMIEITTDDFERSIEETISDLSIYGRVEELVCSTDECGENGSCDDGVCVCDGGFAGKLCTETVIEERNYLSWRHVTRIQEGKCRVSGSGGGTAKVYASCECIVDVQDELCVSLCENIDTCVGVNNGNGRCVLYGLDYDKRENCPRFRHAFCPSAW